MNLALHFLKYIIMIDTILHLNFINKKCMTTAWIRGLILSFFFVEAFMVRLVNWNILSGWITHGKIRKLFKNFLVYPQRFGL